MSGPTCKDARARAQFAAPFGVRSVARDSERGGAIVEFAISLPLLMMVALSVFSGGFLAHQKMQLGQAAREGARYGATVAQNQTFVAGTWASNVRDVVLERSLGVVTADGTCVALVSQSPAVVVGGTSKANYSTKVPPAPCYDDGNLDSGLRVQVAAQRRGALQALVFSMDVGLSARATAKYEG